MIPRSPSRRLGLSEKKTEKPERIVSGLPPVFRDTESGMNGPGSVASIGLGFVPAIGIAVPSKDCPSGERVKYPDAGPNVFVLPPTKSTTSVRLERVTFVRLGKST